TNSATAVTVNSLTMSDNGKLDLTNNDLIIPYSGTSPLATITAMLSAGSNNGIVSSTLATPLAALGVGDAAQLGIKSLDGISITGNAVIVRNPLLGDSTLDGKVDLGNDFNLFLQGFLEQGSGWVYGDFDYSGSTDINDFQSFVSGFTASGGDLGNLATIIAT